jgi:hypothetical protein
MSRAASAADVVVGMLTENTSRMLTQAIRLLRSIRWFGGAFAGVRVVVCGVGALEPRARETLEALGAEIRTVARFHPANPTGNRHSLITEMLREPEELLFLLDCDTIVVRDPLPFLGVDAFQAKIAPTPTVSDEVFERLFAHFGLKKPPRSHIAPFDNAETIPYFNAGVLAIPKELLRVLAPSWRKFNVALADDPNLAAPCQRNLHQAALSLALAETGIPAVELPWAMNFQVNAPQITPPPGFAETDPVILHYHHLATEDGFLLPCPYPAAQKRIEMFHDRMRAEGFVQEETTAAGKMSRPIVILGMHRSGTSLVAQIINAMGVYAGKPDELQPPDMFNPTGYWEHRGAVELDGEILDALAATWQDAVDTDVSRLPHEQRAGFVARARSIVQSLQGRGAFLLKDPRMSTLLPLWRDALEQPIFVIAWRDPMAVARSLAKRDDHPLLRSIAAWELHNRILLRETEGLPRLLVSYEELLADPQRVTRELHASLTALGVEGLQIPSQQQLGQIVNHDFNRSGRNAQTDDSLLDPEQRALLAGLRSGSVLHEPVAPASARTMELLVEMRLLDEKNIRLQEYVRQIGKRDELLKAVFISRSWRIGHRLTGLLRMLRGGSDAISAEDRWQKMKQR